MSIESRMDEFKKVADKTIENEEEIKVRMNEFEEVPKKAKASKEKESALPYGMRRYMPCSNCEGIMEIHEMKEKKVIYRCHDCKQEIKLEYK